MPKLCRLICASLMIVWFAFPLFPLTAYAVSPPGVFISEVAWAGSSLSTSDEWLELTNNSDQNVDVSNWRFTGAGTSDLVLPTGTSIPPHASILISNYPTSDSRCSLSIEPNVVSSTVSLSNSALDIKLFDSQNQLVDRAGSGGTPPAGNSSAIKTSMVRVDSGISGDMPEAWVSTTDSQNLKTADLGNPGVYLPLITNHLSELIDNSATTPNGSYELQVTSYESEEVISSTTSLSLLSSPTSSPLLSSTTSLPLLSSPTSSPLLSSPTSVESGISLITSPPPASTFSLIDNSNFLRLNEVMAAPSVGYEWVEIISSAPDRTADLSHVELHDSAGKIMGLKGLMTPTTTFLVIQIKSSRLNNTGDSVYLKKSDGTIIDTLNYLEALKDTSWARDTSGAWRVTTMPTPNGTNIINEPAPKDSLDNLPLTTNHSSELSNVLIASTTSKSSTFVTTTNNLDSASNNPNPTFVIRNSSFVIRLNEILPNPSTGNKEWIELYSTEGAPMSLEGLELYDASGRIAKLDGLIDGYQIIELTSARLNNSGDSVFLKSSDGQVLDSFEYTESEKDLSWSRNSDNSWLLTEPTPASQNILDNNASTTWDAGRATSDDSETAKSSSSTSKSKTTTPETLTIDDFSMLYDLDQGLRVRLTGRVATPPRLLSGRGFILQNPDGLGLQVNVPTGRKIPEYGSILNLTGTLKFNTYELPYLSVSSKDDWLLASSTAAWPDPKPLLAASVAADTAWSLVSASGTVLSVERNTIHIVADDAEVDVIIRPSVAYRPARLKKGDQIKVTGILDLTATLPTILPRETDDIFLVKHAPGTDTTASSANTPAKQKTPWTAFGAAAASIGLVEGGKRLRNKIKRRVSVSR